MTNHARAERAALCQTLTETGPQAPTLCEGWSTRDLAAHLVIRDRRPDAQAGMVVPFLAGHGESLRRAACEQDWDELVRTIRSGPPRWHPARLPLVDQTLNTAEFLVHHEDVLRARPGWTPRALDADLELALWRTCTLLGRLTMRRAKVGVELVCPDRGRALIRTGQPVTRVEGRPGELLLFLFGRRDVAQVQLDGPNRAIDVLRATPKGL